MKIANVGAGGVGGFFGGKIVSSGYDAMFVARGEYLKAIRGKGLKVISRFIYRLHPAHGTGRQGKIKINNGGLYGIATESATFS